MLHLNFGVEPDDMMHDVRYQENECICMADASFASHSVFRARARPRETSAMHACSDSEGVGPYKILCAQTVDHDAQTFVADMAALNVARAVDMASLVPGLRWEWRLGTRRKCVISIQSELCE